MDYISRHSSHFLHRTQQQRDRRKFILNLSIRDGGKTMFLWAIFAMILALIISLLGFYDLAGISKKFGILFLIIAAILAAFGFIFRGRA